MGTQTLICNECGGAPDDDHHGHQFTPMTPEELASFVNRLMAIVDRHRQMEKLTNRQLVHKLLSMDGEVDEDLLLEICTRLDPGWEDR